MVRKIKFHKGSHKEFCADGNVLVVQIEKRWDMVKNYFKIALIKLKRSKAYTRINVFGLSLAIACTVFIFCLVKYHPGFNTFHNKDSTQRNATEDHLEQIVYSSDRNQEMIVRNSVGMQLMVSEENTYPTLRIVLPGRPTSERAIEIIFPEHVTVRKRGSTDAYQLDLFQPGSSGERPL